ncbi:MAG: GAF domain-containing protein, partial [Cyclobacteriaceae bacterium]
MINTNVKIGTKISGLVVGLVVVTIATMSFIAFNFSRDALEDKYLKNLVIIVNNKAEKIDGFFADILDKHTLLKNSQQVKTSLSSLSGSPAEQYDSLLSSNPELSGLIAAMIDQETISEIILSDAAGNIVYSSSPDYSIGQTYDDFEKLQVQQAAAEAKFTKVNNENFNYFIAPAEDMNGNQAGYFIMKINLQPVLSIVSDTFSLGQTGEIQLGQAHENKVIYLNKMRHDEEKKIRTVYFEELLDKPLQEAVKGNNGSGISVDYRKEEVLSAWAPVNYQNWGLVAKIDRAETFSEGYHLFLRFLIVGLIILAFSTVIAIVFSRILIDPLLSLKSTLQLVGKGILPKTVKKRTNDEIGEMAETVNILVKGLQRTADFAHRIGEGDFAANFEPLSKNDTLGTSLINMRDSIMESEKKDKERNWIVTGLAEIGEILRSHDSLNDLGDDITTFITNKINAIQGAFYVVNDDDPRNHFLELKASYAYGKKKHLQGTFKFAQGLVGQAAIEQDTLLRTEIPEDYVTITSGLLGEQKPRSILIVPLITDEKVFGALEFAGFQRFTESEVKFVQELSLIIARTIFNIKVNERTRNLLAESQAMSNELQEQQEILRQNAEEMEATQEELKRTNHRLEDQIEEVNRTQKRMQLLLENASEVITIYEEDGSIRYISPSVEKILGYPQDEMIGQRDIKYVQDDFIEVYEKMFK